MLWVPVSILCAAVFGVVSVLDKQILARGKPGLRGFNCWVGLITLCYGAITLVVVRIPGGTGISHVLAGVASGVMWALAIMLMFYALKTEEASRTVAVFHTYPVFVALMAVPLLGERVGGVEWLGIVCTVAGAVLVSLRGLPGKKSLGLQPTFGLLIAASFLAASGNLLAKHALESLPFWPAYGLRNLGLGAVLLANLRPGTPRELAAALKDRVSGPMMVAAEALLAPLSVALLLLATSLGPVSLVSTVTSTRPFFVFLYTVALSAPWWRVMNEPLTPRVLAVKSVSIALILGGVALVSLR